jgi:stage V sporulation protein R
MEEDDDFSFVRNYLTEPLAEELKLFEYSAERTGRITVIGKDINRLRELILAPKFNFGSPQILVEELQSDGVLVLRHEHGLDGRGLDLVRAERVLDYLHAVWQRPVILHTVDGQGEPRRLRVA